MSRSIEVGRIGIGAIVAVVLVASGCAGMTPHGAADTDTTPGAVGPAESETEARRREREERGVFGGGARAGIGTATSGDVGAGVSGPAATGAGGTGPGGASGASGAGGGGGY